MPSAPGLAPRSYLPLIACVVGLYSLVFTLWSLLLRDAHTHSGGGDVGRGGLAPKATTCGLAPHGALRRGPRMHGRTTCGGQVATHAATHAARLRCTAARRAAPTAAPQKLHLSCTQVAHRLHTGCTQVAWKFHGSSMEVGRRKKCNLAATRPAENITIVSPACLHAVLLLLLLCFQEACS